MTRFFLLWHTVRYLTPHQIKVRLRRLIRQRWWRLWRWPVPRPAGRQMKHVQPLFKGLDHLADYPDRAALDTVNQRAAALVGQEFTFLNHRASFTDSLWHDQTVSHLWRYHLHYFNYVLELLIYARSQNSEQTASELFNKLTTSWITHNQLYAGDGWHPYTISLRAVNWIHALQEFGADLPEPGRTQWGEQLDSLYGQGRMLFADLELDVRGNHLLENIRALFWLSTVFTGVEPALWYQKAIQLLQIELREQVLSDGGHFERTPGYHLVVLRNLIEIGLWLRRNRQGSPEWLDAAVNRMMDYLMTTLPPDNRLAMFKDTAWDAAPDPLEILAAGALYLDEPIYKCIEVLPLYAWLLWGDEGARVWRSWPLRPRYQPSRYLTASGYVALRDDAQGDFALIDVGDPCPDYLPAHAHADLLSYELMSQGERFVVDSGVYEYTAGRWRDYFRSTRAHNTVELNGLNQSEVWSSFRVARRARPRVERWGNVGGDAILRACHDGYSRLNPPLTHKRIIVWRPRQFWLVLDAALSDGQTPTDTTLRSYIHWSPHIQIVPTETNDLWRAIGAFSTLYVTVTGFDQVDHIKGIEAPRLNGWASTQFGERKANATLELTKTGHCPLFCGYVIGFQRPLALIIENQVADLRDEGQSVFRIRLGA